MKTSISYALLLVFSHRSIDYMEFYPKETNSGIPWFCSKYLALLWSNHQMETMENGIVVSEMTGEELESL